MEEVNRRFIALRTKMYQVYPTRYRRSAELVKIQNVIDADSGYYKNVGRKLDFIKKKEKEADEILNKREEQQRISRNQYMMNRNRQTKQINNNRVAFENIQPEMVFDSPNGIDLRNDFQEYLLTRIKETQKELKNFIISIEVVITCNKKGFIFTLPTQMPLTQDGIVMLINQNSVNDFDFLFAYNELETKLRAESDTIIVDLKIEKIVIDGIEDRYRNKYLRKIIGFEPPAKKHPRTNDPRNFNILNWAERAMVHSGKLCVLESFLTKFFPQKLISVHNTIEKRKANINDIMKTLPEILQLKIKQGNLIDSLLGLLDHYELTDKILRVACVEATINYILYIGFPIEETYISISVIHEEEEIPQIIRDAISSNKIVSFHHYEQHLEPIKSEDFERCVNKQIDRYGLTEAKKPWISLVRWNSDVKPVLPVFYQMVEEEKDEKIKRFVKNQLQDEEKMRVYLKEYKEKKKQEKIKIKKLKK